jgi:hypothetical protein
LNEGTEVSRPTEALNLGNGLYKILPTPDYDSEDEVWEFLPNAVVRCEVRHEKGGTHLLAIEAVNDKPLEFASASRVDQHSELMKDFIERVLQTEWTWISDKSSLRDFSTGLNHDTLNAKVLEVYGVDVSDIRSGNLADIFDRIAKKNTSRPPN